MMLLKRRRKISKSFEKVPRDLRPTVDKNDAGVQLDELDGAQVSLEAVR